MSAVQFRAADGGGAGWAEAAKSCADALLPVPEGTSLGFLYVTDVLAGDLGSILTFLRERTRIPHWVGAVGLGVCGRREHFETPALSALVASFPDDAFRVFGPAPSAHGTVGEVERAWIALKHPGVAVVHGDPRDAGIVTAVSSLSAEGGLYLVGGLSAAMSAPPRNIADRVVEGGLTGVLLGPEIGVATGLTQGCSPIGPVRRVTEARDNIVMMVDNRPALEVFKEDIGELLARDLRQVGGRIFAGIPVRGSDTGDYLVRNLIALDVERQWLAIAEKVTPGDPILFCRRDPASALADLKRMLGGLQRRITAPPKAGLYFSCLARGPNLFAGENEEVEAIRAALGDFPLAGFFGSGEIAHDRLYGYTGVLALFL